jgi:hypothetical protein
MSTTTAPASSSNQRTIITVALILAALAFSFSPLRVTAWIGIEGFFAWMETTWFGVIGQTYGSVFATIQAFHLLSMGLLGGAVFVSDFRLLGWGFNDYPAQVIVDNAHKLFFWALMVVLVTGIFMACGVAGKLYYLGVFWYKMLALATGILFVYFVKRPLLRKGVENISPLVVKMVAIASMIIWVTVATTGRWIGFSG